MEVTQMTVEMDLQHQNSLQRQLSMGDHLKERQPTIVKVLIKQIKMKDVKVKVAAIDTLSEFCLLSGFELDSQFGAFWPELQKTIDDNSNNEPVLSSLGVLRRLFRSKKLENNTQGTFLAHANDITAFLKKAIEHDYSKITFEGLRVCSSFLGALRNSQSGVIDNGFSSNVNQLHAIILDKLGKVNIDTEVKHCVLLTSSSLISTAHSILGASVLNQYYSIFAERMMNELTREAALKGLTMIATNGLLSEGGDAPLIPIANP